MKNKKPIKILKPYKVSRQMNESVKDERESVEFISKTLKGVSKDNSFIIKSNGINNPEDITWKPQRIADQLVSLQDKIGLEEGNRGKRVYPMIYKLNKQEYEVSAEEVAGMVQELLGKYPTYQSVGVVVEDMDDIHAGIIFNNYSSGFDKMTKQFKPYQMSNIYNQYIRKRNSG